MNSQTSQTSQAPILRAVSISAFLLLVQSHLWGQSAAALSSTRPNAARGEDETVVMDTVSVTGSNIKRMEVEKALPVSVFAVADIDIRDAAQPSDLVTALPQVTGLPGNETATLGATARGDNASVSLRGIPSGNTLVLLNGRRLAPHPISQSEAGVPTLSTNINQLPNRGLDRIEVLRDGASSIYGTDAVAGVVNYVMRRDVRGAELTLRASETGYHDGADYRGTFSQGMSFGGGKGRTLVIVDYYKRDPIYVRDRPFAADADNSSRAPAPWNVATNTTFNLRSATSEYGNYTLGTVTRVDSYGAVTFAASRPAGIPSSLASSSGQFFLAPGSNGGVVFMTSTPSRAGVTRDYYWNNNNIRAIQPRTDRTNIFANAEFDLNERVTAFVDASLYRGRSVTYRESDGITASTDGNIVVPASNPFNPFGTRYWSTTGAPNADGTPRLTGTPSAVLISNKRLSDLPTRIDFVNTTVYRGVAGLRGRLGGSWTWEGAVLYSKARTIDEEQGTTRKSLLVAAINQSDPAKAFNPFTRTFAVQNGTLVVTGDYKNPESVTSTFRSAFVREGETRLGSGDFRAAGELLPIWGGNSISAAFGGEFRKETFDDVRPTYAGLNPGDSGLDPTANDFLGFSPNSDTHGMRHVTAAHAELVAPLAGGKFTLPLVRSLEASGSVRFESYTDFGETTKPKFGINWRPSSWVMVRGSYNEGFRAPNLAQLFTGTLIRTATNSTDTYRSAVTGLPTDGSSNRRTVASGNRSLKPELSAGKSAGIVIEVPRIKGLSVTIDYWEIAQKDVIASSGGIADDTAALQAATQAALAAGQRIDQIDLGSGTDHYLGDPAIVRLPVTQADKDFFEAYNARQAPGNQRAVVGAIDYIRTTYFNKSRQFVNGWDFNVNYRLPKLAVGNFTLNADWTYLNDFHAYSSEGAARTEYRDGNSSNVGGATPIWRGHTTITWRRQRWGAGVGFYYIGSYTDTGATTTATTYEALGRPSYIKPIFNNGVYSYRYNVSDSKSYNVFATYKVGSSNRWLDQMEIRFGVNNVFDAQPPLSSDSRGYDVGVYNTLARGRIYSVQITKKL